MAAVKKELELGRVSTDSGSDDKKKTTTKTPNPGSVAKNYANLYEDVIAETDAKQKVSALPGNNGVAIGNISMPDLTPVLNAITGETTKETSATPKPNPKSVAKNYADLYADVIAKADATKRLAVIDQEGLDAARSASDSSKTVNETPKEDSSTVINSMNLWQDGDAGPSTAKVSYSNLIPISAPVENNASSSAYSGQYSEAVTDAMNKILNREPFSYDLNADMLYQQYKDQYMRQGNLAMRDTMGQAAALTGGYGSTYATNAGAQAYQAYLNQLNDRVPELYQAAYDRYQNEGQDLYNQFSLVKSMDDTDYGRYRDSVSDYWTAYDAGLKKAQLDESIRQYDLDRNDNNEYRKWQTEMAEREQTETERHNQVTEKNSADNAWYDYQTTLAKMEADELSAKNAEEAQRQKTIDAGVLESFKGTLMSESEFKGRGGAVINGLRYTDYVGYVESMINAWWQADRLTDAEADNLLKWIHGVA